MSMSKREQKKRDALRAILARIHGKYDAPELQAFGVLRVDKMIDIERIAKEGLE